MLRTAVVAVIIFIVVVVIAVRLLALRHRYAATCKLHRAPLHTVAIPRNLYTQSRQLRGTLDGIIRLMVRLGVRLTPHHISGELNALAD